MRYRRLGRTGISVSEIGFGAWGIGGWQPGQLSYGSTDDATSLNALDRALELGLNFIDTSSLYGLGRSEELIGRVVKGRRERVVLATKAGYLDHNTVDYSPSALERSLQGSLKRLDTDFVDLFQIHGASMDVLRGDPGIVTCLERLRAAGAIRSFGLSANSPAHAVAAIDEFGFEVVQVNFSMLDIRAIECGLFDLARKGDVGVITRTPLAFGFLTGTIAEDTEFPLEDHRHRFNGPQLARWSRQSRRVLEIVNEREERYTNAQAALRFCLSSPEVSVVIPGILTPAEAEENIASSDLGPLPADIVQHIIEINGQPLP
ncbi:MAG: aldo/keto reductase [Rhodospirillaceae bacterium]